MTRTSTQDLQEEFLSTLRKGQKTIIGALRIWVDTVTTVTPRLSPLTDKLPKLPNVAVPFADKLPTPGDAVDSAYGLAEQLLASQRKFADDMLALTVPLMSGRREDVTTRTAPKPEPAQVAPKPAAVVPDLPEPKPAAPKAAEPKAAEPKPAAVVLGPRPAAPKPAAVAPEPKPAVVKTEPSVVASAPKPAPAPAKFAAPKPAPAKSPAPKAAAPKAAAPKAAAPKAAAPKAAPAKSPAPKPAAPKAAAPKRTPRPAAKPAPKAAG